MVSPQAATPHTEPEPLFADVIVPRHLAGPFTYIVPLTLQPTIRIGHRVLVPFGRSLLQGAVIALSQTLPQSLDRARIKEIRSLIQEEAPTDVSSRLFQLSRQVAEQYAAPWGQCLRLMLPPAPKKRSQDQPLISTAPFVPPVRQTDQSNPGITAPFIPDTSTSWAGPLFEALRCQGPSRILVQASWGGRLRLLQDAIRLTLEQRKSALIIVGEAERAQWIRDSICDHETGISPVCFHSGLSDQVKAEIWDRIHRQIVRVVVGTRSAIFLPLAAIGVIWVEGEEDAALKEAQEPRYHARDVAWLRAQDEQAVLVLSSSHPSLETRAAVGQRGVVVRQSIPREERPTVQVVDLRDHGHSAVLSQPLAQAIEQAISRRAGVLLFLNRKGYAGALVCRDCGLVPRCPACRVALMYSRQAGRLRCSYCGSSAPIPETCVSCSGPRMQLIGEGTERVEEDAKRLFPRAAVIRLDGDTLRRPAQAEALWRKIEHGEWDILVGTQLLLRRVALPRMGLVGIVQADAGLSMPDFRSAERTYHLLLDAISLADSATNGGQVIVQTYLSSHHAIQAVAQNEESIFLREELSYRQALGYPPTVYLIALLVSGSDEKMVRDAAAAWVVRLTACSAPSVARPVAADNVPSTAESIGRPDRLTVLGPVPSPVSRLRGRYRWQILVKSLDREVGVEAVRVTVKDMERTYQRRSVKFDIDVDPIEEW
jgi:primosomal protein N' (replication factor Y) (superfamily II helicase)